MMRSQLDTSVYGRGQRTGQIGEILGVIQGIQGISGNIKDRNRQKMLEDRADAEFDDNKYLESVYGKYLAGWSGDKNDLFKRNNDALGEILKTRPELYGKVAPKIAEDMKLEQDLTNKQLQEQRLRLGIDEDTMKVKQNELAYQLGKNKLIAGYMGAANDEQSYRAGLLNLKRIGIQTNLPETFAQFSENPGAYYDMIEADRQQNEQMLNNLKTEEQRLNVNKKRTELDWLPKEKQADLSLTNAQVNKLNTESETKANKQNMPGIDPDTGRPYTSQQNKSAAFAVTMGRGVENIDKLVKSGFNEADFVNQVMNTFRKKKTLSRADFLNIARTPEQRRYLQAQLDFMIPHLRDQSGAVINSDEYSTEAMQYFPITGDDKEVINQKRKARVGEFVARRTIGGSRYNEIVNNIENYDKKNDDALLDELFPKK
jgi:hypothetical protein